MARAGGVALLSYRVAATMRTLAAPRVEEFPCPLPGPGVHMVWNPRPADRASSPGCGRCCSTPRPTER
ncbi:hypothetical protein AB0D59_42850 [Streptomyces sp. NPDC048417]|uniref:hypothetical protein n=1 Tax=Streptomyces sp. NPDC048417 TaxID=3155387 RepID=UPI003446FF51